MHMLHTDRNPRAIASEMTAAARDMKPPISRTVIAGVAGGVGFGLTTFLTFVLIGSGLDHSSGPLFNPSLQSPKVLAVWTQMEPLPLFVSKPHLMLLGYVIFGVGHALLYRSVASAWPKPVVARIWRLSAMMWSLSYVFFEFLGPFNLLGEPLALVALELSFWALAALVEATVIVLLLKNAGAGDRAFAQSGSGAS